MVGRLRLGLSFVVNADARTPRYSYQLSSVCDDFVIVFGANYFLLTAPSKGHLRLKK